MIDLHSTEFYVLAFTVAMALIALLMGKPRHDEATTQVTAFALNPCVTTDDDLILLQGQDDGSVLVLRNALPLDEGDTVNLVATVVGGKLTLVEKKGVQSRSGIDFVADGAALITSLPARRYRVRYESEITGRWALFTFTNRPNLTASQHLTL